MISIAREDPEQPALALLHARHTADMHSQTPPESIHMLPASALSAAGIAFYVLRKGGVPVGMGAVKRIDTGHAELKSMHVLAEHRGGGLARRLLDHLIAEAAAAGYDRLSLETGVQPVFDPARRFYLSAGFAECPPFAGYGPDPNSLFMTRRL